MIKINFGAKLESKSEENLKVLKELNEMLITQGLVNN